MAKVVPVDISRALTDALVKGTAMSCLADFEVADFKAAAPETGAGRAATDLILREQEPTTESNGQPTPQLEK